MTAATTTHHEDCDGMAYGCMAEAERLDQYAKTMWAPRCSRHGITSAPIFTDQQAALRQAASDIAGNGHDGSWRTCDGSCLSWT